MIENFLNCAECSVVSLVYKFWWKFN